MTTYFVKNGGSDVLDGLSDGNAWATLAHAQATMGAGDTLNLHDDSTWRETFTVQANSQTFQRYGSGTTVPFLSGADVMSGFTDGGSNIWDKTGVTTQVNIVFINGTRGTKKASRAACTTAGDWFWVANTLSVFATSDPSGTVEAGQRDVCIDQNGKTGLTLSGIGVKRANSLTLGGLDFHVAGTINGFVVTGCTMLECRANGMITRVTSTLGTVTNNTIRGCGLHGICYNTGTGETNQTITGNTIYENGWSTDINFSCGIFGTFVSGEIANNIIHDNATGGSAASPHGIYCANNPTGGALLIHDNTVYNHTTGSAIKVTCDATIYNNICYVNAYGGLQIDGTGTHNVTVTMHHNVCYGNCLTGGSGVSLLKGTGTLTVNGYHNTLYDNSPATSAGELNVQTDLTALTWKNNIHYGTTTVGSGARYHRLATQTGTVAINYNCYFGSPAANPFVYNAVVMDFATWKALAFAPDANSINAQDPLFTNAVGGDFRLQSTSPCKDTGVVIAGINDGTSDTRHYRNTSPDIGAIEYEPPGSGVWTVG